MAELISNPSGESSQFINYKDVRLPGGLDLPCIDIGKSERGEVVSAITDKRWLQESSEFMACARSYQKTSKEVPGYGACYVIGVAGHDVCKIGYSANPIKRTTQIANGLWCEVYCHALLWSLEFPAGNVEYRALQAAKKGGHRLKGEWIGLSVQDATELVLDAAGDDIPFVDSETFIKKWVGHSLNGETQSGARMAVSVHNFYDWAAKKYP